MIYVVVDRPTYITKQIFPSRRCIEYSAISTLNNVCILSNDHYIHLPYSKATLLEVEDRALLKQPCITTDWESEEYEAAMYNHRLG